MPHVGNYLKSQKDGSEDEERYAHIFGEKKSSFKG